MSKSSELKGSPFRVDLRKLNIEPLDGYKL